MGVASDAHTYAPAMRRLPVAMVACALLAGCGSSGAGGSPKSGKGADTFVAHTPNAVMLVRWTRTGRSVSGSLTEAIAKRGRRGVSSAAKSFTGTINGRGLSLQLGGEALVGQFEGGGFSLTLPGAEASGRDPLRARPDRRIRAGRGKAGPGRVPLSVHAVPVRARSRGGVQGARRGSALRAVRAALLGAGVDHDRTRRAA